MVTRSHLAVTADAEAAQVIFVLRYGYATAAAASENTRFTPPLLGREVAFVSNNLATTTGDSNGWRRPTNILPTRQVRSEFGISSISPGADFRTWRLP